MKADIWNKRFYIEETDPKKLVMFFGNALKEAGFGIVSFSDHHFEPFGYTAFWLLSESHFAIHTFPEDNKTYCELSSCSEMKYGLFVEQVKEVIL